MYLSMLHEHWTFFFPLNHIMFTGKAAKRTSDEVNEEKLGTKCQNPPSGTLQGKQTEGTAHLLHRGGSITTTCARRVAAAKSRLKWSWAAFNDRGKSKNCYDNSSSLTSLPQLFLIIVNLFILENLLATRWK